MSLILKAVIKLNSCIETIFKKPINFNINFLELMKKLEDKFEAMAFNLENKMLNNFIKPSQNTSENNMKFNINEMKKFGNFNLYTDNINQHELDISKYPDSSLYKSSMNRQIDGCFDTKITEINKLGEKLYDKLMEKVIFLKF